MILLAAAALVLGQHQSQEPQTGATRFPVEVEANRIPKTVTGGNVLIKNGRILTVTKGFIDGGDVLIQNGKIAHIGKGIQAPAGVSTIDATGRFVSPGLVDAHSHRGQDVTNEGTDSIVAEVRIHDVLNSEDQGLYFSLASGITTSLVLHGSANPIGGQSVVIKHKWRRPVREIIFPGAPRMIKFALGENPRGVNRRSQDGPQRYPNTRMGVESIYRRAFNDARNYMREWEEYEKAPRGANIPPPRRDLRAEAIADILRGRIWVQCHSYRQDEMLMMVRLSQEFGFKLVMQHALEAYKIAPELAAANVPVSMFGDGHAYKLEVVDSMPAGAALCDIAGVLTSVNTDTTGGLAPLVQDAARAIRYGLHPDRALALITINAAKQLGIADQTGSLEVGKNGDIAIWQGHPLSTYTKCQMALIDGEVFFERRDAFGLDNLAMASNGPLAKKYEPSKPLPRASSEYLLTGGTVHAIDGSAAKVQTVLIRDGKIAAVGAKVEKGPNAVTVDATGLHVFPGFIDAGSLLGLTEVGSVPQATDARESGDFAADLMALRSINPESVNFPKVRVNGVTTTLVRPQGSLISGQGALIDTIGFNADDMAILGISSLHIYMPEPPSSRARAFITPEAAQAQERQLATRIKQISEFFEGARRHLAGRASGQIDAIDVKLESLAPYLDQKLPVVFHTESAGGILRSLALAKAVRVRPVIAGGQEAWKVAKELSAAKTPVVLTPPSAASPGSNDPLSDYDPYDSPLAVAALLHSAGVKIAFQSNSFDQAMNLPFRVGRFCAWGLPHQAALRGLTLDAAEILGVADRYGSLTPGKVANVIVTDGDPLEVTTELRYLFVEGKPVPLESKYTELFRKYRARFK